MREVFRPFPFAAIIDLGVDLAHNRPDAVAQPGVGDGVQGVMCVFWGQR